jgi:hypothetical protein
MSIIRKTLNGSPNRRRHLICTAPAKPCWNIGLKVYVSRRGGPVRYYYGLLVRYGIEGFVIWRPIPQEAVAEIDDAYRNLTPKKK